MFDFSNLLVEKECLERSLIIIFAYKFVLTSKTWRKYRKGLSICNRTWEKMRASSSLSLLIWFLIFYYGKTPKWYGADNKFMIVSAVSNESLLYVLTLLVMLTFTVCFVLFSINAIWCGCKSLWYIITRMYLSSLCQVYQHAYTYIYIYIYICI